MPKKREELPKGWEYTGHDFFDDLYKRGTRKKFYFNPEVNAIYQVKKMHHPPEPNFTVRFIDPNKPESELEVKISGNKKSKHRLFLKQIALHLRVKQTKKKK